MIKLILDESIENVDSVDSAVSAMDPNMAQAKEDSDEREKELKALIDDTMNGETLKDKKPFIGAEEQPVPEEPILSLDESLFEAYVEETLNEDVAKDDEKINYYSEGDLAGIKARLEKENQKVDESLMTEKEKLLKFVEIQKKLRAQFPSFPYPFDDDNVPVPEELIKQYEMEVYGFTW